MAESFKPVALVALAGLSSAKLAAGYIGFIALLAPAFFLGNTWLWAAVCVTVALGGWFALRCIIELVKVIIEVLVPQ
jgi:hypothetical protein